MSKGNNRGNARLILEKDAAYQNIRRNDNIFDNIRWYISLYRSCKGDKNNWKVASCRIGGKVYEAHVTIKERDA
jgi:hypothetical protein